MTTVFLGGSRRVTRLNASIRKHLDQIMHRHLTVCVGDANGADKAMQQHMAKARYDKVTVFAVAKHLRNNVGSWPVRYVQPPRNATGRALFEAKDRVMAEEADAGLMLWDGVSKGTLANIRNLLVHGKPVAIYHAPGRRLISVRTVEDVVQHFPDVAQLIRQASEAEQRDLLEVPK